MKTKKEPLPECRSGSGGVSEVDRVPTAKDNTTPTRKEQGYIASILLAKNANNEATKVAAKDLTQAAGLSNTRVLQDLIESEREYTPIISGSNGGYWLANPQEATGRHDIAKCATTLIRRGAKTIGTGRKLRRFLDVLPEQVDIDEV